MPEDLKKLETFDYKPLGATEQPVITPPATMGFNSVVVKPETRVNKTEVAEQPTPTEMPDEDELSKLAGEQDAVGQLTEQRFKAPYKRNIGTKEKPDYRAVERVNKTENTGQHLDEYTPPKCALIDENGGVLANPEQPDQNLMIIEEIEGLISQVNDKLWELNASTMTDSTINKRLRLRYQACEKIDLFQKTTLFELRHCFE